MSIYLIAEIEIKIGTNDEFEYAFEKLRDQVLEVEPDTLEYRCYKVLSNQTSYRVIESYASKAAVEKHMNNKDTKSEMRAFGQFLAKKPNIVELSEIASSNL